MSGDRETRFHSEWLGLAQPIEGLVFSLPVLVEAQIAPDTGPELSAKFRELLAHTDDPKKRGARVLEQPVRLTDVRRLFAEFLEYDEDVLLPRHKLPEDLRFYAEEGRQEIRPSYAIVRDPEGASEQPGQQQSEGDGPPSPYLALVWDVTDDNGAPVGLSLDKPEAHTGPWRYPPTAKFERLLRHAKVPIGLLTNGHVLRLVYAPKAETTSHLTFRYADMAEAAGRPVLTAFELLLGARRTYGAAPEHTIEGLLQESRRRQADVTKDLADQVFEAVELLLAGFEQAALRDQSGTAWLELALQAPHDHLYRGILSVVLRLVFILYSEDQGLFPIAHPIYANHLSVLRLYEDLVEDAGMHPESMHYRFGAYGRLLSLFRAIFLGVKHGDFVLPARQGRLFDPSSFPFLEGGTPGSTAAICDPAQRAEVFPPPIDDGVIYAVLRRLIVFKGQRLSYRALDVEQIGSVYESLMGYHVVRTKSPAVRIGKNAVWVELADLAKQTPTARKKWLKDICGLSTPQQTKVAAALKDHSEDLARAEALTVLSPGKKSQRERHRVPPGKLVLQPGDERRRSGSHYTPRSLTERIVRRTLEPVLACLGQAPTAEQILSLKVCDPAMGSGAFLVEACRHLGEQLVAAWTREGNIEAITEAHNDPHLHARRLVAQRCLYGVDKNDAAVELAKLSLWLVTMSRELPFTFVDHALRHGDSLVGLDLEQIASFQWERDEQLPMFKAVVKDALDQAIAHRKEIHELAAHEDNLRQREKRRLLDYADYATEKIRLIADVCVGAFFAEAKTKARKEELAKRQALVERWLTGEKGLEPQIRGMAEDIREQHAPFHWWLEFPEVFYEERPDPLDKGKVNGAAFMEAFVGNPPFLHGLQVARTFSSAYVAWLASVLDVDGRADLSAHFFVRSTQLLGEHGTLGLLATNTIAQGDTRQSGLLRLVASGWSIYHARQSFNWPGLAAVTTSAVHIARGSTRERVGRCELDGRYVDHINSRLRPSAETPDPVGLVANIGSYSLGWHIYGGGFVISEAEYLHLCAISTKYEEVIRPFIGGQDINTSPMQLHSRYVIHFGVRPLQEAAKWPLALKIVSERVKPYRDSLKPTALSKSLQKKWWQFYSQRENLTLGLRSLERCLVTSQVTKHLVFSFQPVNRIFGHTTYVFLFDGFATFAVVQSRIHEPWAWLHSSTMRDAGIRYTPSDCFDTFPFPKPDPRTIIPTVEAAGKAFYEARAAHMVATDLGLTKTYNALKDPDNTDPAILELRRLTEAMDRVVLDAYGWTDIVVPPYCPRTAAERAALQAFEDEVIDRLYVLNAERAAEEERLGLRKRKKATRKKKSGKKKSAKKAKKKASKKSAKKSAKRSAKKAQANLFSQE